MKNSVYLLLFIKTVICDTGLMHMDLKELQSYIEMLMFWSIEESMIFTRMKMKLIYISEDSAVRERFRSQCLLCCKEDMISKVSFFIIIEIY